MFRQLRSSTVPLLILLGLAALAPAQSAGTGSPSTAYQRGGKWVGYVPSHLKHAQRKATGVFRASLADVSECLSSGKTSAQKASTGVVAASADRSAESFDGALLDGEGAPPEPRVLATSYDDMAPVEDPAPMMVGDTPPMMVEADGSWSASCEGPSCGTPACGPTPRWYGRADYLMWWLDGMTVPALATTSPDGTVQNQAGVLGQPGTSVLFGDSGLDSEMKSGGRFTLGLWLDPCHTQGVDFTYFTVGTNTASFGGTEADFPILARPFYNVVDGAQDSRLIAYDGLTSGLLTVTASTQFDGGEVLFRQAVPGACWVDIDLLAGYRWAQLDDSLSIEESTLALSGAAAGTAIDLYDRFDTQNNFHGAEIGLTITKQLDCCWSVELLAKLGLGNMNSVVFVDGQTVTVAPTGSTVTDGGLLAQGTNMGRYERDRLATASELGLTVRRRFGNGLDLTCGYTFLYLSDVARAGDHVDPMVNTSQIPPSTISGAELPEFDFQTTGFWAQGLSFGLEYRY